MSMPKSRDCTIQDVIKSIDDGDYRIPSFQRDFVWDTNRASALIDSIFKGFPIGSIILWKTKTDLPEIKELGDLEIPGKDTGKYTSYVIDGQQRITSLYYAIKGLQLITAKSKVLDYSTICIDLLAERREQIVYSKMPDDRDSTDFVLLKDLLNPHSLLGEHSEKRVSYYNIILQYAISIIEIDDDTASLEDVVEIFERLNLGGKKLSLFSIIAARSYVEPTKDTSGFDLNKKYKLFNASLKSNNYGEINEGVYLQTISTCLIDKANKAEILRSLKKEEIVANYEKIETALRQAIEHLKGPKYGAKVANLLPYQSLLVPFAYFHYKIGKEKPTDAQEKYLIDFFWRCVIGKRYNSSSDTCLNADIAKINSIINGETPMQETVVLSPKYIFENGRFILSSAFVKGMLCLMAQKNPKSFVPGRTVNITNNSVAKATSKQLHHFFPTNSKVILNNKEYANNCGNVINIVFLDAITNDQISNSNPSKYTGEFSKDYRSFPKALESHMISLNGFGLDEDDYYCFINKRSSVMFGELQKLITANPNDSISNVVPFN